MIEIAKKIYVKNSTLILQLGPLNVASSKLLKDWKKKILARNAVRLLSLKGILVPKRLKYLYAISLATSSNKKTNKIKKCNGHNL